MVIVTLRQAEVVDNSNIAISIAFMQRYYVCSLVAYHLLQISRILRFIYCIYYYIAYA